jgi:hypothetical protein
MKEIIKGATLDILHVVYVDPEGVTPANLTGATMRTMVKARQNDSDGSALITKNIGSGITITDAANGKATTRIDAADTNSLSYEEVFIETQCKLSDGRIIRSGAERFQLLPNVQKVLL